MMMCELHGGTLSLVHAWSPFGESLLRSRLPKDEFDEFVEGTRATAAAGWTRYCDRSVLAPKVLESSSSEGRPEDVIPSFARRVRADLVVMGTVARSGVAGAVIGNTAEKVLQRLRGSVMAIRPSNVVARARARRTAVPRPRT
jgi:nucleotide-binding universal stress UspA family protein